MNRTIETIMNRRSVRSYEPKPISKEIMRLLIDAGNAAPSGCNAQSWRFVIVENEDFKKKLLSLAIPKYEKWMENAPEALIERRKKADNACSDPIYYNAPYIVFVIGSGMTGDFDTPMVCQNIMLTAYSLGIGSCWVFFGALPTDDPEIKAALEMKEGEKVYGPILLGYPKGGFPEPPEKKDAVIKWI